MKMFRCRACPDAAGKFHEFQAVSPVCTRCGLDGTKPENAGHVPAVSVVHFDAPGPVAGRGVGRLACQPDVPVGLGHVFTGVPAVVNCPACRETDAFRRADAAYSFDPRHDVPVRPTRAGPVPAEPAPVEEN